VKRLDHAEVVAGACFAAPLVDDLRRVQMVQYAGASGDYNPLHTDEVYATRVAGYPTVFAHGMLIMGMVGRILGELVGEDRLREFGGRFVSQVWPGDSVDLEVRVESVATGGAVGLALQAANQRSEVVFSGTARALFKEQSRRNT
jgi:acyl dehydratase